MFTFTGVNPPIFILHLLNMDFEDEEAPPLLVNVQDGEDEALIEPQPIKVPITIVTGR